jgi:hypothetical protein
MQLGQTVRLVACLTQHVACPAWPPSALICCQSQSWHYAVTTGWVRHKSINLIVGNYRQTENMRSSHLSSSVKILSCRIQVFWDVCAAVPRRFEGTFCLLQDLRGPHTHTATHRQMLEDLHPQQNLVGNLKSSIISCKAIPRLSPLRVSSLRSFFGFKL